MIAFVRARAVRYTRKPSRGMNWAKKQNKKNEREKMNKKKWNQMVLGTYGSR